MSKGLPSPASRVTYWRALLQTDASVAFLLFVLGLAIRVYFALTHPHFNGLFSVRGVPFSDGQTWTSAAIRVTQGHGFGEVYRPFYSFFLALFFCWTGWSPVTITILNVLIAALTAAFLFLVVRFSFGCIVGLATAVYFIFDPSQIIQIPQAVTEPLGLLFFVLSIYCLHERPEGRRWGWVVWSGVFFGLSNLTRPLTLFCAPAYALGLLLFEWRARRKIWPAVGLVALFTVATTGAIAPWLVRQKLVNDIWSISSNLGESWYGATSPLYRTWTPRVRLDADRAGVPHTVGARYKFFIHGSTEQIRKYPEFYSRQVGRALWSYLSCFGRSYRSTSPEFTQRELFALHRPAQLVFLFIAAAMLLCTSAQRLVRHGFVASLRFLLPAALLFAVWQMTPASCNVIWLLAGLVCGLTFGRSKEDLTFMAVSLFVTGIGNALFNNAILYRAVLMTDWLFAAFYLAALYYLSDWICSAISRSWEERDMLAEKTVRVSAPSGAAIRIESRINHLTKILALLFFIFAGLATVRLTIANIAPKPVQRPAKVSPEQEKALVSRLKVSGSSPPLIVKSGILPYYIHFFPKGTQFVARDPLFRRRDFSYSYFRFAGWNVIFPGRVEIRGGQPAVLIVEERPGETSSSNQDEVVECRAIIPLDKKGEPDYAHRLVGVKDKE